MELNTHNVFGTKPGIIKTENDFQGIIIKGIDKDLIGNSFPKI